MDLTCGTQASPQLHAKANTIQMWPLVCPVKFPRFPLNLMPHNSYSLSTRSWALLFAFPQVNSTSPAMSVDVCLRVILWTVPIFSSRTWELDCKGSPFKVHTGDIETGAETSHSKQASSGAETSTSVSSFMIDRDWADPGHRDDEQWISRVDNE